MGGASKARRKYRTRPLGDGTRGLRHKILSTKHIDDVAYTDMYVCLDCFGTGTRVYGNTATWRKKRGAISGQAFVSDVCDKCWGTGRTDEIGENLRDKEKS